MEGKISTTSPNLLRKYRREMGFTQTEVARILGINSTSRISKWENGTCMPSVLSALKLAILYRVMVDAFYIDLVRTLRDELRDRENRLM